MHFGWKAREKNVSTWAAVLITTVFLLKADTFKIKEDILVQNTLNKVQLLLLVIVMTTIKI